MSEPDSTQSQNTDVPAPRRAGPAMPYRWPASDRLWRLSRRLTPDLINTFLKFRSARGIPDPQRARFEAMNLPDETIDRALGEVHKLEDWVGSWSRAAQRFMAESRRNELVGEWDAASVARRNAALCYHVAHLITLDDPRTVRALRASAVQSFLMSIQQMNPETRKIGIPWRTRKLPGYLSIPLDGDDPLPLIVVLNGATTTKEETFVWSQHLNGASYAILNLDWPGTGEAADGTQLSSYCDDMTDGIFELAEAEDRIDPERVALVGVSLGGVVALRAAAMDRRVWAVATVTPPFDPRKWIDVVNPLVASQLVSMAGNSPSVPVLLEDFSLPNVVSRVRCPTLVFGAARDLVVPPDEATRTAGAIGD